MSVSFSKCCKAPIVVVECGCCEYCPICSKLFPIELEDEEE